MQIQKLEKRLGVQLLERTHKSVILTDAGKKIVERVRHVLIQIDEIYAEAKVAGDLYSGELKIGIIPTSGPYLLPHIMPSLKKAFPKLIFYLHEEKTIDLLDKLKRGDLDAVILALPIHNGDFSCATLFEEAFILAVPKEHDLNKRKIIKQAELKNKQLLLLDEGHCLRDQALSFCQSMLASESNHFRATSLETLRHMVASGSGITLIPQLACRKHDGISYLSFTHPAPSRTMGFLWRRASARKVLLENIAEKIKKIMALGDFALKNHW
jgi:LysR family transcriptional regulator, hydrogen peroxide-inducible genes activator